MNLHYLERWLLTSPARGLRPDRNVAYEIDWGMEMLATENAASVSPGRLEKESIFGRNSISVGSLFV